MRLSVSGGRLLVTIVVCCCTLQQILGNNESNILRLSKVEKGTMTITSTTSSSSSSSSSTRKEVGPVENGERKLPGVKQVGGDEKVARKVEEGRGTIVGYSKNNPELDWKNQLKIISAMAEEDSRTRLDTDFMIDKLESTRNSIQWLSDLYDPLKWSRVPGNPREDCRQDLDFYLKSLREGKLWAAKMSDASGRYSSQFHFGNGFWLGSSSLCREVNATATASMTMTERSEEGGGGDIFLEEEPPYHVKFHVARMYLSLPRELEASSRQVFLGLCLPARCDKVSLTSLLRASADRVEAEGNATYKSGGPKIHIVDVKPVPSSDYCAWKDAKFYVLSSITAAIVLLMICATAYDYKGLSRSIDIESNSASNNNEKIHNFSDKNIIQDRRISMVQDNGIELIEKESKNKEKDVHLETSKQAVAEKGLWRKCLMAFSPIVNGSKIISTEPAARDSLTCLHGLRVLSLGWVVLVHTYLQVFSIAENKTLRMVTERNFMFQTISNATFSVDTFFFISGLLVTILFYRSLGGISTNDKDHFFKSSFNKFIIMILYRFIRLTPAYLFVLGINEIAIKQAQARTVFSPAIIDQFTCEKFWWRNALYLNSLYPRTEMCMLWSWYMANDTQFYVLGILLLLLSVKYLKVVTATVVFIIVSSWFTTFSIAYSNDYIARIQEPFALFDELYDKPWLRAGPYFIGTVTGYLLFKTNCKLRLPMVVQFIGWLLSAGIMLSLVYGLYPSNLTVTVSSIYAALGHTAWAIAIAFIVIQCCTGSARLINSLLSLRLMYPLSRLTYCAYLVHPVIMMITSTQMDGPLHLHNGMVLIVYFGNLVASYLLSFCISIGLEAPVVNLLKIVFTTNKKTR